MTPDITRIAVLPVLATMAVIGPFLIDARLIGFIRKEQGNPAHGVPLFKHRSDGWEPWPKDVRAEFENIASPRARLVYELCVGTGQRIGDVLKFRWNHFTNDAFDFTQGKTDKPMWIPLTNRLRDYLAKVLREGMTIVVGSKGQPAHYRVVTDEMSDLKKLMKHPGARTYVTHGLRKNATIELYLDGYDDEMVKAMTGHSGVETLKKYGGIVRQRELATPAQEAGNRAEQTRSRT